MWDQMKEHSIVSPLQAKRERERDNKHLVNIPQNVGPNERTFQSFSLTSKERQRERTSSEHPSKCGTKWKTMYHILSLTSKREAKMNISSKYGTKWKLHGSIVTPLTHKPTNTPNEHSSQMKTPSSLQSLSLSLSLSYMHESANALSINVSWQLTLLCVQILLQQYPLSA
jgi:hypothetical protein